MNETVHHKPKRGGAVKLIVFLAFLVVVTAGGVFAWKFVFNGPKHTDTQTKTYDEAISRLDLEGDSGDVDIVGGDTDEIVVETTVEWRGDDKPGSDQDVTGKTLRVAATGCEGFDLFGDLTCEVHFRVEVPAGIDLKAQVDSGDLSVAGMTGEQDLGCDSGNVEVEGSGEKLTVRADSGDVTGRDLEAVNVKADVDSGNAELSFAAAPEKVRASADSGDVTLSVPEVDGGYDVSISVDSGDKDVQVKTASDSPRKINGTVDSGDLTVDYS